MQKRSTLKVAAVQAAPVGFDLDLSLNKLQALTQEAALEGAELVVFPEAFLSAYPWRYAFDATVGTRELRGRQWYAKYYESSVAIPSPEFDVLRNTASTNNIILSVGIIEKDGATLYCTSVLIGKDGEILSRHRKLVPTGIERLVWGRGAGDGIQVADTEFGKMGGLICWENYMPAARLALYQLGVEIYIAPHADDLSSWIASMQHIAKEGRCFVLSVNQFCKVSDFPCDYPPFTPEHHDRAPSGSKWIPEDILNHGGTCVIGPLGIFIAEPVWDREEIVYATLNLGELTEARMDFDTVGSYARPDIFTLLVNKNSGINVSFV